MKLKLVMEGDSWFDLPGGEQATTVWGNVFDVKTHSNDLVEVLREIRIAGRPIQVVSVASHSEKLTKMAEDCAEFLTLIKREFSKKRRPDAILLSAGGNDLIDKLSCMLMPFDRGNTVQSSVKWKGKKGANKTIEELLDTYEGFLHEINDVLSTLTSLEGQRIPVFVHGYAYAIPDGRNYKGVLFSLLGLVRIKKGGPWLQPEFVCKGYPVQTDEDHARNARILAKIIDGLNERLSKKATSVWNLSRISVQYVDLRRCFVSTGGLDRYIRRHRYKKHWEDEFHLTHRGLTRVAKQLVKRIRKTLKSTTNTDPA